MREIDNVPLIVEIKRHSLEDGPGIRTVVFFKGCPLQCVFCQNPETQDAKKEIAFSAVKCIHCGMCERQCPTRSIELSFSGRIFRETCIKCGVCAKACPVSCFRVIGSWHPVDELIEILMRDVAFYRHSYGGVTFSGGECTMYPEYLEHLLKELKKKGIHVVLETCGHFNPAIFEKKIFPYVDLVYYDLKIADSGTHEKYTGMKNETILENLSFLIHLDREKIITRIPLIPGITGTEKNLRELLDFLHGMGAQSVTLVPFNPMGSEMAEQIGKPCVFTHNRFMNPDDEKRIFTRFASMVSELKEGHKYSEKSQALKQNGKTAV